jgi:hypothetical protein
MAENLSAGVGMTHVDTRCRFVHENIVDDFSTIIFFMSCDNDADVVTKNVSKDAYR